MAGRANNFLDFCSDLVDIFRGEIAKHTGSNYPLNSDAGKNLARLNNLFNFVTALKQSIENSRSILSKSAVAAETKRLLDIYKQNSSEHLGIEITTKEYLFMGMPLIKSTQLNLQFNLINPMIMPAIQRVLKVYHDFESGYYSDNVFPKSSAFNPIDVARNKWFKPKILKATRKFCRELQRSIYTKLADQGKELPHFFYKLAWHLKEEFYELQAAQKKTNNKQELQNLIDANHLLVSLIHEICLLLLENKEGDHAKLTEKIKTFFNQLATHHKGNCGSQLTACRNKCLEESAGSIEGDALYIQICQQGKEQYDKRIKSKSIDPFLLKKQTVLKALLQKQTEITTYWNPIICCLYSGQQQSLEDQIKKHEQLIATCKKIRLLQTLLSDALQILKNLEERKDSMTLGQYKIVSDLIGTDTPQRSGPASYHLSDGIIVLKNNVDGLVSQLQRLNTEQNNFTEQLDILNKKTERHIEHTRLFGNLVRHMMHTDSNARGTWLRTKLCQLYNLLINTVKKDIDPNDLYVVDLAENVSPDYWANFFTRNNRSEARNNISPPHLGGTLVSRK